MIGLYGVGSTLAGSDSPHYFWGMLKVQVYSVKVRNTSSEAAHHGYVGFRKCVHAPHSLQLGTAAHYRKEMSLNHLLYIVLYVSKLYGPSVGGSSLVSSGLLSYKNIVECGRNCFDITNSQVVNFGFWVFWGLCCCCCF